MDTLQRHASPRLARLSSAMLRKPRNELEDNGWRIKKVNNHNDELLQLLDCGDADLNEYFRQDAIKHQEQLISQTYYLSATEDETFPVAFVDLCNDSIRLKKIKNEEIDIPDAKRYPFLPAVKITRLGVQKDFHGLGVGSHLINMIKKLFITRNRTGCRFLTVDAYNRDDNTAVRFYQKNGFQFFSDKDIHKQTRAMYFDLKRLAEP